MCMWNVVEHSGKARDWSGLVGSVAAALIRMDIIRDIHMYIYISVAEIYRERYVYIYIYRMFQHFPHTKRDMERNIKELWRKVCAKKKRKRRHKS